MRLAPPCVETRDHGWWCWGWQSGRWGGVAAAALVPVDARPGSPKRYDLVAPEEVPEALRALEVVRGGSYVCGRAHDGRVRCLPPPERTPPVAPMRDGWVLGVEGAAALVGGADFFCTLREGRVSCFGDIFDHRQEPQVARSLPQTHVYNVGQPPTDLGVDGVTHLAVHEGATSASRAKTRCCASSR